MEMIVEAHDGTDLRTLKQGVEFQNKTSGGIEVDATRSESRNVDDSPLPVDGHNDQRTIHSVPVNRPSPKDHGTAP